MFFHEFYHAPKYTGNFSIIFSFFAPAKIYLFITLNQVPLVSRSEIQIRFSDTDALGIVWHGNFIKYFEDGREAFSQQFGLNYLEMYNEGFATPIVKTLCEHKKPLKYGETAIIETEFVNTQAAKIHFRYKIFCKADNSLAATGETVQVFLTKSGELFLNNPPYFENWKSKYCLLK